MKLIAVTVLVLGMLSDSMSAMAEGPVPFRAIMQTAGAQPSVSPLTNDQDKSTALSSKPVHRPRMTSGGRIMTGAGIAMLASGALVIAGTAVVQDWASPSKKAGLFVGGGGLAATGTVLIVLGSHRRSAQ
jgi:hypothetical protein